MERLILRGCVFLLLAAMLVVPPMVRATRHLADGQSASNLSLNRGFDSPEAKCQLPAPTVVRPMGSHDLVVPPAVRPVRLVAVDEALPDVPCDPAPEAQRGPPSAHLA